MGEGAAISGCRCGRGLIFQGKKGKKKIVAKMKLDSPALLRLPVDLRPIGNAGPVVFYTFFVSAVRH